MNNPTSRITWLLYVLYPQKPGEPAIPIDVITEDDRIRVESFAHSAMQLVAGTRCDLFKVKYVNGRVLSERKQVRTIAELVRLKKESWSQHAAAATPVVAAPSLG